jgi:hypothetical protein
MTIATAVRGTGKTEYAISRIGKEPFLLHMDIDNIREFFSLDTMAQIQMIIKDQLQKV